MMGNQVNAIAAAPPHKAVAQFEQLFGFETDCWDVYVALPFGQPDFAFVDVRSPDLYRCDHVPGALGGPHGKVVAGRLNERPPGRLFVVYYAGGHRNWTTHAVLRLSEPSRAVTMIANGIASWVDGGIAPGGNDASS